MQNRRKTYDKKIERAHKFTVYCMAQLLMGNAFRTFCTSWRQKSKITQRDTSHHFGTLKRKTELPIGYQSELAQKRHHYKSYNVLRKLPYEQNGKNQIVDNFLHYIYFLL
nr:MAG TPA: hypothetical protein [Bacteriophage sp.]